MQRARITISLSPKNDDAATVLRALGEVQHWKRSTELLRWAAAYLNGEAMTIERRSEDLDVDEIDALMDDF